MCSDEIKEYIKLYIFIYITKACIFYDKLVIQKYALNTKNAQAKNPRADWSRRSAVNPDESHVGSPLRNGGGNGSFFSLSPLISVWNLGDNDVSAGVGRVGTWLSFCNKSNNIIDSDVYLSYLQMLVTLVLEFRYCIIFYEVSNCAELPDASMDIKHLPCKCHILKLSPLFQVYKDTFFAYCT